MRLQTVHKLILTTLLLITFAESKAQLVENNGSQVIEIGAGGELINQSISHQTTAMTKTSITIGAIATKFLFIKDWEGKYNSYLKTTDGFASALKNGATLYAEGVTTLRHLYEIKQAIEKNPSGLLATMSLNNLYAETASELIKTYHILKHTLAKGGTDNMLTGAERAEILWMLNDNLHRLNDKLKCLALSVSYFNMVDVWNQQTAGLVYRDHGDIAKEAHERWRRAAAN